MPVHRLTKEIIEAAIGGFEARKHQIDAQIAELRGMLSGTPTVSVAAVKKARRKMSAAAIERIREGQKRRWAAARGKPTSAPTSPAKPKRTLSAAGRKAIVAALKKRWAAKKAAANR